MQFIDLKKHLTTAVLIALAAVMVAGIPIISEGKDTKVSPAAKSLPLLVDLGRRQCTPCKMMAPILDELKREYAGVLDIKFIDVGENPDAIKKYGIRAIPFQVFYDASGKEVKRHYGYMSKEEILDAFKELGLELKKGPGQKKK